VKNLLLLRWLCTTHKYCVSLDNSYVLLQWLCTTGSDCMSLDSRYVLLAMVLYHWKVVVYYYGKLPPYLRGSVDDSTSGTPSLRFGCRPREIGYIYHKGVLMVNGPRCSPSLIMTRNNMESRYLMCFPCFSLHWADIHS
jgi:hypothetical protein